MAVYNRQPGGTYLDEKGRDLRQEADSQMSLVEFPDGSVFPDTAHEDRAEIIEPDGTPSPQLPAELMTEELTAKNFLERLTKEPQAILEFLLSKQSNIAPLKKGGTEVSFKCEAMLLSTRLRLNDQENLMLDIVQGIVSSRPEDNSYTVTLPDFARYLNSADRRYANKLFKEAKDGLFTKTISLSSLGIDYDFHIFTKRGYRAPRDASKDGQDAFVVFELEPVVKCMMISSGFTRGIHYRIEWSSKLSGRYRIVFFYAEYYKHHKAYMEAVPGHIYFTVEEMREMLGVEDKYKTGDIYAKILRPAMERINSIPGIDLQLYITPEKKGKSTVGYTWDIRDVMDIPGRNPAALPSSDDYPVESGILKGYGFSDADVAVLLGEYNAAGRDLVFLTKAVSMLDMDKPVEKRRSYLAAVIRNGIFDKKDAPVPAKKNRFNDFEQREYDYDKLEQMARNTTPK
jgi:plasmid replication initiation protein